MKNIIVIAAVTVVLLAGMGGGFYVLLNKIADIEKNVASDEPVITVEDAGPKPIYNLATLIVNLSDKDGRRYLRTSMDVEITRAEDEQKIVDRLPQVKDAAIKIMSTRAFTDINSIAGKDALRDEMVAKLNEILKMPIITNIYFTEFVVQ